MFFLSYSSGFGMKTLLFNPTTGRFQPAPKLRKFKPQYFETRTVKTRGIFWDGSLYEKGPFVLGKKIIILKDFFDYLLVSNFRLLNFKCEPVGDPIKVKRINNETI
jgi:hypothetical protein